MGWLNLASLLSSARLLVAPSSDGSGVQVRAWGAFVLHFVRVVVVVVQLPIRWLEQFLEATQAAPVARLGWVGLPSGWQI